MLHSRSLSAGFVSADSQLTANATMGKNWMLSCLLEGATAAVDPGF
jgi:hypothetical protein